jgi:hypothetical protein
MSLLDHNGREVGEQCMELRRIDHSSFIGLRPGQSVNVVYEMRSECYLLDPGETLMARASYTPVDDWPDEPAGTVVLHKSVATQAWQKIVVPKAWKNPL